VVDRIQAGNPETPKSINQLVAQALTACDPDLRAILLGHVVLTGGGSLLSGFADRLNNELIRVYGNVSDSVRAALSCLNANGRLNSKQPGVTWRDDTEVG
jgi:actin-related protein